MTTRADLQRLYDECTRADPALTYYRTDTIADLVTALGDFLAGDDPTVEVAYLKAKVADLEVDQVRIERVRALHYAADNDIRLTPRCSNCLGKAGVHECGCWADEDRQPVCGHCRKGRKGASVDWPCPTIVALGGES